MLLILVSMLLLSSASALDIDVEYEAKASGNNGGWYPWYELAADPSNPKNLIVCGSRWDARHNAFSGFVYASADDGKTWRTALEDKHSAWVTEHSCAFGINGRAYFVSEASKVIDGNPHHESGTTRIFVSRDGGQSWGEAARTSWADYSVSVVDGDVGPNQNRLYIFYNDNLMRHGGGDRSGSDGTRVSAISFKDNEPNVEGPLVAPEMRYQGSYPQKAFALKDGSLLAIYFANVQINDRKYGVIGAVRTNRRRTSLHDFVLDRIPTGNLPQCYPSEFAAAYASGDNRLFVAYPRLEGHDCQLILKTSSDGGRTWSTGSEIPRPKTISGKFYSPAMAVNQDGILGLLWRDQPVSNCWYFSASGDNGRTFAPPIALSHCSNSATPYLTGFSSSLRTSSKVLHENDSAMVALEVQVVDSRNRAWRNTGALISSADGVFHAVWIEVEHGEGELRSAAIRVARTGRGLSSSQLIDRSADLIALYGGAQHYDRKTNTLMVNIILKNKSLTLIRPPLFLRVLKVSSDLGQLQIANSRNGLSGRGAIWDISRTLPNGVLEPGASTRPFPLMFHVPPCDVPNGEVKAVSIQFRALVTVSHPLK